MNGNDWNQGSKKMRKQQLIWQAEHETATAIPSLAEQEPSSAVVYFADFLKRQKITSGKIIDIGCGKGRNSIYMAKQGFEVYGLDYIHSAISACKKLAEQQRVSPRVRFETGQIDDDWKFADNFFDIAVDCFSSIDIETKSGREKYRNEMLRTLKPNGYAFVAVVSAEDEFEKRYIKSNPGAEKNSVVWPQNGKFQKDYDEAELRAFYSDFEIVKLEKVTKPAVKCGEKIMATNYLAILKNSKKVEI